MRLSPHSNSRMENTKAFIPALVLGLLAGWMAHSLWNGEPFPVPNAITAMVAVIVGWVIQKALRSQGELDQVPIGSVARLFERIEELLAKCLEHPVGTRGTDSVLLTELRSLSNELNWLGLIVERLEVDAADCDCLKDGFFTLNDAMTGHLTVAPHSLLAATKAAQSLRTDCLVVQWQICRSLLEEPADLERLKSSRVLRR